MFIETFVRNRFLRDYVEPVRLLYRLNQVMRRIRLEPLPDEVESVLRAGQKLVGARFDELLPSV